MIKNKKKKWKFWCLQVCVFVFWFLISVFSIVIVMFKMHAFTQQFWRWDDLNYKYDKQFWKNNARVLKSSCWNGFIISCHTLKRGFMSVQTEKAQTRLYKYGILSVLLIHLLFKHTILGWGEANLERQLEILVYHAVHVHSEYHLNCFMLALFLPSIRILSLV